MNKTELMAQLNKQKFEFHSVHRLAVDSYRQGINDALDLIQKLDVETTGNIPIPEECGKCRVMRAGLCIANDSRKIREYQLKHTKPDWCPLG